MLLSPPEPKRLFPFLQTLESTNEYQGCQKQQGHQEPKAQKRKPESESLLLY